MASCAACGKQVSTSRGGWGLRERDLVYHIRCAPDDLLDDATSEWDAILDRGMTYFVKKYSPEGRGPNDRRQTLASFAELGGRISAESKRRKK